MLRSHVLVWLLTSVALAGCVAEETPVASPDPGPGDAPFVPPVPDHDFGAAVVDLHAHENPTLHVGGFGLELVAWNDLTAGALTSGILTGQYNEVDTCGTLAVVASFAGNRGFTLVDLSDPARPEVLSQFPTASTNWDVRLSRDCTTAFVGMELGHDAASGGAPLELLGLQDTGRGGILVVDVSDPTRPVRESYNPVGSTHNVFTYDLSGETYVFNEHVKVMKLVGERGARTLEVVAEVPGVHDVHVEMHPQTGVPYLFTGTDRLSIWNLTDPEALDPEKPDGVLEVDGPNTLWHEQTAAPKMIDGRWLVIGGGESGNGQALPYSIVDVTDPTAPELLGEWMLPGAPFQTRGFYTFSPHNVAIRDDGRVATGNYHAGIWVFDVSTQERQADPVTLGYHLQSEVSPTVVRSLPYAPYVWGAAWLESGELVTADLNSGLYVYSVP